MGIIQFSINIEYPKQHGCRALWNISQSNSATFMLPWDKTCEGMI